MDVKISLTHWIWNDGHDGLASRSQTSSEHILYTEINSNCFKFKCVLNCDRDSVHIRNFCIGCITIINKTRILSVHLTRQNILAFHTFIALAVYPPMGYGFLWGTISPTRTPTPAKPVVLPRGFRYPCQSLMRATYQPLFLYFLGFTPGNRMLRLCASKQHTDNEDATNIGVRGFRTRQGQRLTQNVSRPTLEVLLERYERMRGTKTERYG
jgi:hypothetical protein